MKHMKKIIYALIFALVVISGLVFANREMKNKIAKKPLTKSLSAAEKNVALKKWEASPDGILFKKWEASAAGKKVYAGASKIRKSVKEFSNMEAIVTSLSLPQGTRLGYGVMVKIKSEDYILAFGLENSKEFDQLHRLKVNDKIIVRSHGLSYAPKYSYPIVAGDYVEQDGKQIYRRIVRKGGC
jgi:hypothetical protein